MHKLFTLLGLIFFNSAVLATELADIRIYPSKEYTRLVVEANSLPGYRLRLVENPQRLVLDINTNQSDHLLSKIQNLALNNASYLKNIRSARFTPEKIRIVFDLNDEVTYSLFNLDPVSDYGHRVVLDISPSSQQAENYDLLTDLGFTAKTPKPKETPSPTRPAKEFLVVLDPGHGGEDPGAVNKDGVREKHIVLDIAKKISLRLKNEPGINVKLTREDDLFLPLATRVRIAQVLNADLFLSIHADSFTNARPRGASVFVLSKKGASSKLASHLAEHANLSDRVGGINTSSASSTAVDVALTGIFKDGKERASRNIAQLTLDHLSLINVVHGKEIHAAGFAVLKSPAIPSALVEVGFISNPNDAKLLLDNTYRNRVAEQIAAAIVEYKAQQENIL